jgi:hypothetical protein
MTIRRFLSLALIALALTGAAVTVSSLVATPAQACDSGCA